MTGDALLQVLCCLVGPFLALVVGYLRLAPRQRVGRPRPAKRLAALHRTDAQRETAAEIDRAIRDALNH